MINFRVYFSIITFRWVHVSEEAVSIYCYLLKKERIMMKRNCYHLFNNIIGLSHSCCHNVLFFLSNPSVAFLTQLHSISEYCRDFKYPSSSCGDRVQIYRQSGDRVQIYRQSGDRIKIFRQSGDRVKIYRQSGDRVNIYPLCL
jgi:hypothetical protein